MSIRCLLVSCLLAAAGAAACQPRAQVSASASAGGELADEPTGAELWSASCRRCHAMRSPSEYGAESWKVVMMHMRVRANLTGREARAILSFLRSGR